MSPAHRLARLKAIQQQLVESFCQQVIWPVRLSQAVILRTYFTPQRTRADLEMAYIQRALQQAIHNPTELAELAAQLDDHLLLHRPSGDLDEVKELVAAPYDDASNGENGRENKVVLDRSRRQEKTVMLRLPRIIALDLVYILLALQEIETEPFCASPFCLGTEEGHSAELRTLGKELETTLLDDGRNQCSGSAAQQMAAMPQGDGRLHITTRDLLAMTPDELETYLDDGWRAQQVVDDAARREARQRILGPA